MLRHTFLSLIVCTSLLLCPLLFAADANSTGTTYAIVLASAAGENLKWEPRKSHLFKARTVYVETTTIKRSPWERLCLGYFETHKQATLILDEIQQIYPGAWIQQTTAKNIPAAIKTSSPDTNLKTALATSPSTLSDQQLGSLMQRAKQDFKTKKYSSAIRYLTAVISAGDHQYSREALELLGLSRQRKGQRAHAVDIYEKYLALYPEGEASDRVRQRVAGLLTATSAPRDNIHMSTVEDHEEITSYGSLAQSYRSNTAKIDGIGSVNNLSQLFTFIDLTMLQRSEKFDHHYQFTSDHSYDFIDSRDNSEFRFIETYYELSYRKTGSSGRFGRQTLRVGGTLQRFDGLSAGYQLTPEMRLNILGGFPVDIDNKSSINKHKTFYGFTFETGTFLEHWDMNLFYFDQQVDGLTDRNSVGTELRYRDNRKSLFSMIDYDIFYQEVNILQLITNIMLDHGRVAYMNAFMRKAPLLSTSNALIGQQQRTIEELKKVLNIEQIYQLARDRTANSQTITVGGSLPLTSNLQTSADITMTRVDDTIASGGVAATPETGPDYFLSAQLVSNNFFVKRNTNILGIRYYTTDISSTTSLIANTRFPITTQWRINPRLQFDIRKFTDGRSQQKLRAILKTDYRHLNKVRFDFEVGYDETSEDDNSQLFGSNNLFFMLGYRWDF